MATGSKLVSDIEEMLQTKFVPSLWSTPRHRPAMQQHFTQNPMISEFCARIFGDLVLPEKDVAETRPALMRPPTVYATGVVPDDPFPFDNVKRALLFSDAVALDMTAIYGRANIAYTTMDPGDEFTAGLLFDMADKLIDLAQISDLMRDNIVLPFSGTQEINKPKFRGRTDPLFATKSEAQLYVDGLKAAADLKYTSDEMRRAFYYSFILDVPTLDIGSITWDETRSLRKQAEIFAKWRALMRRILERLYDNRFDFTDGEREFRQTVREEVAAWMAEFEAARARSPLMSKVGFGMKRISIGWISGTVLSGLMAAALGTPLNSWETWVLSGAANAGPPLVEAVVDLGKGISAKAAVASLNHHVVVIKGESE